MYCILGYREKKKAQYRVNGPKWKGLEVRCHRGRTSIALMVVPSSRHLNKQSKRSRTESEAAVPLSHQTRVQEWLTIVDKYDCSFRWFRVVQTMYPTHT